MKNTIEENELNFILKEEFNRIFQDKEFGRLSNFERRECVFNYIVNNSEYDFSLLDDIYSGKTRNYAEEVLSVLKPKKEKKGICNSFSYAYKILLDKLNIPSMLVFCNVLENSIEHLKEKGVNTDTPMLKKDTYGNYLVNHMLVLVQSDNGTFSFDDITYAIFNKGTDKQKDYFDYNLQMAKQNKQVDFEGFDTDILRYIIHNSEDTKNDEVFRKRFAKDDEIGFLTIPKELIQKTTEAYKFHDESYEVR